MSDSRAASRTIIEAVIEVLSAEKEAQTAQQIYQAIRDRGLYQFKAKDPEAVMRAAIRKALRDTHKTTGRPQQLAIDEAGRIRLLP